VLGLRRSVSAGQGNHPWEPLHADRAGHVVVAIVAECVRTPTVRTLAFVFCAMALSGCDESNVAGPSVPLNQQFTVAVGQTATVADTAITIRCLGVPNDSRCPGDATCITAGDATVSIEVLPPDAGRSQYALHTADMKPVMHSGLTIVLLQLDPYPFVSRPIQPGDYRATLRVTR